MPDVPAADNFPEFDSGKVYLVKGATLNKITSAIRASCPQVVTGGGLLFIQQTDDGRYLAVDPDILKQIFNVPSGSQFGTLNVNVCINNVSTPTTFLTLI